MSEALPLFSRESFVQEMRTEIEQMLGEVADAVNATQAGAVITESEEPVRDLFARMRQRAYERAVQMKIEAAQAAFPPSGASPDGQTVS